MEERKNEHLRICLTEQVESSRDTGLGDYDLEYDALPELDFEEVSLETEFLGKKLKAPLMIGAMTGGTELAEEFNRKLARAAERAGIAMALGSQRPMLKGNNSSSYEVKKWAPGLPFLMGNLGAVQLNYGVKQEDIEELIERTQCDGFAFHLNPLQEAIQPEGDRNWKGVLEKLAEVIPRLSVPVSIKEVGCGISRQTAEKLKQLPIQAVETAGAGGTSWAYIEALRSKDPVARATGIHLKGFGIPTAESIIICREAFPHLTVIGSGGIRTGLEVAKALALGADIVAMALPFLKAAEASEEDLFLALSQIIHELKTVLFITGSKQIGDLRKRLKKVQ